MPANVQAQADRYTVEALITMVRDGEVRIPRFQRGLRWQANDVVALFDSIYRGYPIGSLLFSRAMADESEILIGPIRIAAPQMSNALWVVDGQQRITALFAALARESDCHFLGDDPWRVYFDSITQTFNVPTGDGPVPGSWVPTSELLDAAKLSEWVHNWENSGDRKARTILFEAGARIRQYQIPAYIVETKDERFLRDIFHRTNNYGRSMKWSEIHDAIFGYKGDSLSTLGELADELQNLGMGKPEEDQLLTCLLGARGLDVTRSFVEHYRRDEDVLKNAVPDTVETRVGQQRDQLALRGVRRGHAEPVAIDPRESVVGLTRRHPVAPPSHPFTERPQRPVPQALERAATVVGSEVIAEAADDRVGSPNLMSDRDGAVAEQGEQRIPMRPHRPAARTHLEFRRIQPLELPADEVEPLRVTDDPRLLVTQP